VVNLIKEKIMLYTNLKHIENAAEYTSAISDHEYVVVICGRMGPMCIPVYRIAEELEQTYQHVRFYDMEFDNPESSIIRILPEVRNFKSIPFVIYYKNGNVVNATAGFQSREEMIAILDQSH